jgi:O-antigen ligase
MAQSAVMTELRSAAAQGTRADLRERIAFSVLVGVVTLAGWEFPDDGAVNLWYAVTVGQVGGQYLLMMGVLALALPLVLRTSPPSVESRLRASGLYGWVLLAGVTVAFALIRGLVDGAPHLFADWLNLAFLAATVALAARWLASRPWRELVLTDLTIVTGAVAAALLLRYAAGGGVDLLGVRIPVFSGAHLQIATFAAMTGFSAWLHGVLRSPTWYARAVRISTLLCSLLVLISFRRSHWMLFVLGMVGVIIVNRKLLADQRAQLATLAAGLAVVVAVVVTTLGSDRISERIDSFSLDSESTYANTNEDHYNDILDALDVIAEDPVLGLGIGRFYETQRIRLWKVESFDVHNAPVHAWLKFGLLGLVSYLGFHLAWARFALRRGRLVGAARAASVAVGVFVVAELLVSLVGTWPYGSFQMSMHRAVLLSALLAFPAHGLQREGLPREGLRGARG